MRIIKTILFSIFAVASIACAEAASLYVKDSDKGQLLEKIKKYDWGKEGLQNIKNRIDPFVERHATDPEWIVSRMAMYWKDGHHYTQCYLKNQNWDRGEGNAPVPTVRMPGMRTWNKYTNVPLEDRIPYNESGDMLGVSRTEPDSPPVLVPYKESGHMIRANNGEILSLAEDAAFLYWLEGDERYAQFASDIFYVWLLGTYYMNPILDPEESTGGKGGYEPGGICGYYDYEQIHDDLAMRGAAIYNFMYDYLENNPSDALSFTGKSLKEAAGDVFKRFIDIGMVRGGKTGNWNVNGWSVMLRPIMMLEDNDFYADGKGRDYYLNYLINESTPYHDAIPDIVKTYDPVTGLWPESPGYAFGVVGSLLDFAAVLRPLDIDILEAQPIIRKAALAVIPWMDSRGNLPVFGDCRGGAADFGTMEALLSYYTAKGDKENADYMAGILSNGMDKGTYKRTADNWVKLCNYVPIDKISSSSASPDRLSYSPFHRVGIIKSATDQPDLMAILYGGRDGSHLTANGLALQLFGNGYALAPDAAGYESYWSEDQKYHQSATGANTILPGYTAGEVEIIASDPVLPVSTFTSSDALTPWITAIEMKAAEKQRLATAISGPDKIGYYIDIFWSDQPENDYLYHNVGKSLSLEGGVDRQKISVESLDSLPLPSYQLGYKWFSNIKTPSNLPNSVRGVWDIDADGVKSMVMYVPSTANREFFLMDAPYTTLNPQLTPGGLSAAPLATPTLLIRQKGDAPIIGVFEPVLKDENIVEVNTLDANPAECALRVKCKNGITDILTASKSNTSVMADGIECDANLGMVRQEGKTPIMLYMIHGQNLKFKNMSVTSSSPVSVALYQNDGKWYYSSTGNATCQIGKTVYNLTEGYNKTL